MSLLDSDFPEVSEGRRLDAREYAGILRATIEAMGDGVVAIDALGTAFIFNEEARRLLGGECTLLSAWIDTYQLANEHGTRLRLEDLPLVKALAGQAVHQQEVQARSASGEVRYLSMTARPFRKSGTISGAVVVMRDVTRGKREEMVARKRSIRLEALAIHDELTGLLNRRGFLGAAELELQLATTTTTSRVLFFIDLDGLKQINDELGHSMGDAAIKEAAEILKLTFRKGDLIGRLGGDEFVVLASGDIGARVVRDRIEEAIRLANEAGERTYQTSMSMGVARFDPEQPQTVEGLLSWADASMYEEKRRRKSCRMSVMPPAFPAPASQRKPGA